MLQEIIYYFYFMKNSAIRIVVLLGTFSIIGLIVFQVYWSYRTFSAADQEFNQKLKIALYSVAENLAEFNHSQLPLNPIQQISSNYFIVNTETNIDTRVLEHFLQVEFNRHNLSLDYEYAIYDCETDEMVYGRMNTDQEIVTKEMTQSFTKDEDLVYYFGIIFPGKTSFLIQDINIIVISTSIIFAVLIFFAYALFIILKQKRLSDIQKNFINNMTHEFKTPLSTISIASDVLNSEKIIEDPDRLSKYASIVSEQNNRLEIQIEKFLQLASLEKNKINLRFETFNLHEIIEEVVTNLDMSKVNFKGNIELSLESIHQKVKADKLHVRNIIYNLLDNAVKYGGSNAHISISTKYLNSKIVLKISDDGPGIEKKHLKKIFRKFYRVPTGDVHTIKGFGLGLNYVAHIVKAHKWKIRVTSKPVTGTDFIVILNPDMHE